MIGSPLDYAECSLLAQEVGKNLLSRLDWLKLDPQVIADMGCGTGELTGLLASRYPMARIIGIDHHPAMLAYARQQVAAPVDWLLADSARVPLPDHALGFIYSNFLLPWHTSVPNLFQEWRRLLRPNSLLMLSSLGPDTLQEWRDYLHPEDSLSMVDMHEMGDALMQLGFVDPVLEVEHYTLTYQDPTKFLHELTSCELLTVSSLVNSSPLRAAIQQRAEHGELTATFEVVYCHAWTPATEGYQQDEAGLARVPLSHLRRQIRGG
ncbi:MAG: hypothetical protein A3J38_04170 [Gammaproteobacteria bacterium RIFCSPHIGHO2_12_FULL_45_9]|nr:MAG: hypothetical protein A3J38_04170 [Gammaproteobacteria bacterium RIFCSPHIGHO2_12_FULL_45_9]